MRRTRWTALFVLPVLLLAGDFLYWRFAVEQLRESFEAWTVRARASGWDIRHGAVASGGWPDAASLRIENVSVAGSVPSGRGDLGIRDVEWGSDRLLLRTHLARPNVLEATPVGPRELRINHGPPIPMSADHLQLRLTLRLNAAPREIDVEAVTLAISIPGLGSIQIGNVSAHVNLKPDAGRDQPAINFSLSAHPVSLPEGVHWGLGPEIEEVELVGVMNGPLPSGRGLAARATSWRDEGGSLELHRVVVGWGQTRIEGTATLALDEDLQPMGTGTGKISGYGAALDALAANAVLTRSAAKAAKAVLTLLANTPADGKPEEVEVPLTLQFRTLSVQQVPLVRLPELDWPDR
ncbi:MAG: DUF2125 domain-containing protein [Acetobacteraceae bacterium]|nr:DUF2125 domain-containing protein [Acetobacteraceae bacterium]